MQLGELLRPAVIRKRPKPVQTSKWNATRREIFPGQVHPVWRVWHKLFSRPHFLRWPLLFQFPPWQPLFTSDLIQLQVCYTVPSIRQHDGMESSVYCRAEEVTQEGNDIAACWRIAWILSKPSLQKSSDTWRQQRWGPPLADLKEQVEWYGTHLVPLPGAPYS